MSESILKPINQCKLTGYEKRVPFENWFNPHFYESKTNSAEFVRIVYKDDYIFVSGILLIKKAGTNYYSIIERYTLPSFRNKGIQKDLIAIARMSYNDVRIDY